MAGQDESDNLLRLAATLYYRDGLDQSDVADLMGISRSTVSRLLARAREKGIVRISVEHYDPRHHALEEQLQRRFRLNHAIVIRTVDALSSDHARRTVGYLAAPVVSEMIRPHMVVGIAGGRTLHELVRHLMPIGGSGGITVVQLMGNIGPTVSAIDASELGRILAQRFGGTLYTLNAPALAADPSTRDVFLAHQHIRAVRDLFSAMHIALVGIGSLRDSAFIQQGILDARDSERLHRSGAVGEICGRFFDDQGQECATDYRDRVISITLDELRQVREVVGVVTGSQKASAVTAALRGHLITALVIDDAGAEAVLG